MEITIINELADIQSRLFTVSQLLNVQNEKQEMINLEIIDILNQLKIELRLLSLARCKLVESIKTDAITLLNSQTLNGLVFSNLEYCPTFFEPNILNHYMTFTIYLRNNPKLLVKAFYHHGIKSPQHIEFDAFSLFLTLYQQGWCIEEDELILQTLIEFVDYQFSMEQKNRNETKTENQSEIIVEYNLSDKSLMSPKVVLKDMEPFATFLSSFLLNASSFMYLQCSFNDIVSILHSLSSLRTLHSNFEYLKEIDSVTNFEYWKIICKHAKLFFNSLINCFALLPPSVPKIFSHIKNHEKGGFNRCILLFFEGFVNRVLDNPSILGLSPWHPDTDGWSPSKDIASVFRAKYSKLLPSRYFDGILPCLELIQDFKDLDFDMFIDKLCNFECQHSILMSEPELLSINSNFPKEIIITPMDILTLKDAAMSIPNDFIDEKFNFLLNKIRDHTPAINDLVREHFKIALQRPKETYREAKKLQYTRLFNLSVDELKDFNDPFGETLCSDLANMPSFNLLIKDLKPTNFSTFLEQVRIINPYFMESNELENCDHTLYYAVHNAGQLSDLIPRISKIAEAKHARVMEAADKTSALNTQFEQLSEALKIAAKIRLNVQSFLLYNISMSYLNETISQQFQIAMSQSYNFLSDVEAFTNTTKALIDSAANLSFQYKLNDDHTSQIIRILFFKMTEHLTLERYQLNDRKVWKRSVILKNIIKEKKDEINQQIIKDWENEFNLRRKYLDRIVDLIGHIRAKSGISILLYYVTEAVSTMQDLKQQCKGLSLDLSLLWVVINSKAHYLYAIKKLFDQFFMKTSFGDALLTASEIQQLGVFSSVICLLLRTCKEFDQRITNEWD